MLRPILPVCLWAALLPAAAAAQAPAVEVSAGARRLHYAYRFENDSSFDTPFLVPHFFEQRYERTGPDLELRLHYRLGGREARTSLAFSPGREAFGSDFDTFFQPGGDIATSGTAGDVRLTGLGIEQSMNVASRGGRSLALIFGWRREHAAFLPADRVVTHTRPPSETRELTTDRETTISQTFEVGLEGGWQWQPPGSVWRIDASARIVPALRARLLVQLPDKYPGRDIVFSAAGWSVGGRAHVTRRIGRISAGGWVLAGHAGSYRRRARFERHELAAGVLIGYAARR